MNQRSDETDDWGDQGESTSTLNTPALAWLSNGLTRAITLDARSLISLFRDEELTEFMRALTETSDSLRRDLRTKLLIAAEAHKKTAPGYSVAHAVEHIALACAEGLTSPEKLMKLFTIDELVTACPALAWKLLANVVEGAERHGSTARERTLLTSLLEDGLDAHVLHPDDLVEGLGIPFLKQHLTHDVLATIMETALAHAHNGHPFGSEELLNVVTPNQMCETFPIADLWLRVLRDKIALPNGWVNLPDPVSSIAPPALLSTPTPPAHIEEIEPDSIDGEDLPKD